VPKILINASLASSLHNFRGPLIRDLLADGFEVHVSAPAFRPLDRSLVEGLGAQVHELPLSRAGLGIFGDLKYLLSMVQLVSKLQPDRILNYTIKPNIWGSLAARLATIPAASMITGLGFAFAPPKGQLQALVQFIARSLYRLALVRNKVVFFQNPDDLADFRKAGILPASARICMINGSGVDLDYYIPKPLPDAAIFLMIARLLGAKGIREFASACGKVRSAYPEARFILVGPSDEGPDGISVEEVESLCAGTIEYRGSLEDVRPAIAEASVYVLPSYREGTPRSSLEAMAIGRPVITTDAPGCRATVVDGENGLLVPVADADALALAMEKLAGDADLRRSMAARSLEIARSRFNVKIVNDAIIRELR
jgi:glycosyltransferase involved in cell wall biosynthesis